ncbi:ribonuclease toxin HepT-like protein [Candidatus Roseilinea sp. NK_OTU-006]|jgi:hypothetical protein|uniref:ribonuclease toxin HepT-like protein n=1 Tax=Candidatus Roseilinea sp. NK_OTU-006 TaxID=2704250 RepID=UPI00145F04EF|nr:hypothetical protein [Candidatus Roseilinea sp. NK_OTU-006]
MTVLKPERLELLAADIREASNQLDKIVRGVQEVLVLAEDDPARRHIYTESLALKLQSFYTGCERVFRVIADELNGGLPSGSDWHLRLLQRASVAYRDRPQIIAKTTADALDDYLAFRHVVRNAYTFDLDAERVEELARSLPTTFDAFSRDLQRFVAWLEDTAARLSDH